jgi:nucleoid DNA-binding protein
MTVFKVTSLSEINKGVTKQIKKGEFLKIVSFAKFPVKQSENQTW